MFRRESRMLLRHYLDTDAGIADRTSARTDLRPSGNRLCTSALNIQREAVAVTSRWYARNHHFACAKGSSRLRFAGRRCS